VNQFTLALGSLRAATRKRRVKVVLGKPMLGTLTPLTGFGGRDMAAFLSELVRHPNRYAFSVHENMLRNGERVTIFGSVQNLSHFRFD
jgi:hypothetical protein